MLVWGSVFPEAMDVPLLTTFNLSPTRSASCGVGWGSFSWARAQQRMEEMVPTESPTQAFQNPSNSCQTPQLYEFCRLNPPAPNSKCDTLSPKLQTQTLNPNPKTPNPQALNSKPQALNRELLQGSRWKKESEIQNCTII